MSDLYKTVNGKKVRACKYTCSQMLAWDNTNNYYIEVDNDNQHHTPERCKAFKEIGQDPNKKKAVETIKQIEQTTNNQNNKNPNPMLTVQEIVNRLKVVGINLDLATLLKETNGKK
jgi:hypothetical protein